MAEYKYLDWNPYSLPREILEAIGLVTSCYAQTESMVQEAITGCTGLRVDIGTAVTTHMNAPMRVDALRAVAEIVIDDLDLLDELDEILDQFNIAAKKRNAYAHHSWCMDPETREVFTANATARGTLKSGRTTVTVDQIRADAQLIYDVGAKLVLFLHDHRLLAQMPDQLPPREHKTRAARKKRREAKAAAKG